VIDVALVRDTALGLPRRYDTFTETTEWLTGVFRAPPYHLLPPTEGEEGPRALARLAMGVNSIGPRALGIKANGAIGSVTWGGEDARVDNALRELGLDGYAHKAFDRMFGYGIAALVAMNDSEYGVRLARIGGHVEPVMDPFDVDVILGLLQVQAEKSERGLTKYRIRLWDTSDAATTVREWIVRSPSEIRQDVEPSEAPTPRWMIMNTGPDGRPIGEFQQALPVVKSEWATQVRGDRVEESTAFPQAVVKGEVLGAEVRGPTRVIEVSPDGDYRYVLPGDLREMHTHHDRKLERIRDDLALPGGALGGQTPSGEALREANQKFISSCHNYAEAITGLLTQATGDYLSLLGLPPVPVSVDVNREYEKAERVRFVLDLYREGLLPLGAAVRSVSAYLPTWSDAEVEAWIAEQERVITPDDFRAALGVVDGA
jgi:hypothetical protein